MCGEYFHMPARVFLPLPTASVSFPSVPLQDSHAVCCGFHGCAPQLAQINLTHFWSPPPFFVLSKWRIFRKCPSIGQLIRRWQCIALKWTAHLLNFWNSLNMLTHNEFISTFAKMVILFYFSLQVVLSLQTPNRR